MELKQLNAKKVRVGAKNGLTMDEFCEKYNCSVEQFSMRVAQLYGGDMKAVSQIINQIERNSKRARNRPGVGAVYVSDCTDSTDLAEPAMESGTETELEKLRSMEENLKTELAELVELYDSLAPKHDGYLEQLEDLKCDYEKLREQLIAKGRRFDKLADIINKSAEAMDKVVADWRAKSSELAIVTERLASLRKVRLSVTENGVISAIGNEEFPFNEMGSEEWYHELLLDEDTVGELKLRDIRVLARVLAIVVNATRDGYPEIVVEFNTPSLADAYDELK